MKFKRGFNMVKLPKYAKDFLTYIKVISGKSENTIIGYRNDLTIFFRFLKIERNLVPLNTPFEEIEISDCDKDFIKDIDFTELLGFMEYSQNVRNNIASSKARKIACIRSFFHYLYKKARIIDEDISKELDTPKIGKRNPLYLTLDESKKLLYNIDKKSKNYYRDYCIIILFLNCGLRLSELVNINLSDINNDIIRVVGKGNKERFIYLTPSCINAIKEYLPYREEILNKGCKEKKALFISNKKNRLNKRTVEDIVKKNILRAGLQKKYSPHKLRHTAATNLYKYGNVDIRTLQAILGHESVSTTQIYTHIDSDDIRAAINKNPLGNI